MKNTIKFSKLFYLTIISLFFNLFITSCNRDNDISNVTPPKNELENKGHDNWTKVEIIIREGHLHGANFHGNPFVTDADEKDGVSFLPKEQKIIFEQNEKGEVIRRRENSNVRVSGKDASGRDTYEVYYETKAPNYPIEVITGTELDKNGEPASARYSMEIIYYNGNERMNSQFLTPEQLEYHQHFFTAKEYTNWKTGRVHTSNRYLGDELFKYTYRDTNPEDKMIANRSNPNGARLSNDPVGLKGYFYFVKDEVKFDMTISLAHLYVSKYQNGKTSPANNPSVSLLLNGTTDFVQHIPFVVIGNSSNESEYVQSLMKYYSLTEDQVYDYIFARALGGAESSNFWL